MAREEKGHFAAHNKQKGNVNAFTTEEKAHHKGKGKMEKDHGRRRGRGAVVLVEGVLEGTVPVEM